MRFASRLWLSSLLVVGIVAGCAAESDDRSVSAPADSTNPDVPASDGSASADGAVVKTDGGGAHADGGGAPSDSGAPTDASSKPDACKPTTCAAQGKNCGTIEDGCGAVASCGVCSAGSSCGAGGVANVCAAVCTPSTCAAQGKNCGQIANGCGGLLDCGTCGSGKSCGGGGTANVCGATCLSSCAAAGTTCGSVSNGCGQFLDCGRCTSATAPFCASGTCHGSELCDGKTRPLGGCYQHVGSITRCVDYADSYTAGSPTSLQQQCVGASGTWIPAGCPHTGSSGGCKVVEWSGLNYCFQQIDWSYAPTPPVCGIYAGNIQGTFVSP